MLTQVKEIDQPEVISVDGHDVTVDGTRVTIVKR